MIQKHRYKGEMKPDGSMWCEECENFHLKRKDHAINRTKGRGETWQLGPMRHYVLALMKSEGRDFHTCELCSEMIDDGSFEIHHTKYFESTYQDLKIVCKSCNVKGENRLLR